jgi:spore coat protein U-like protein
MRVSRVVLFAAAIVIAGAAGAQTSVTGSLTGSPTPFAGTMDFGTQAVGSVGAPQTETITAHLVATPPPLPPGMVVLIQSVASSNGEFQVTGGSCPPGIALTDGQTCDVQLAFTPAAVGPRSGTLSVQCTVTAAVGVIAFVCDGVAHPFIAMNGLGALQAAIPTLGREALTALALLLMLSSFHYLRRRR